MNSDVIFELIIATLKRRRKRLVFLCLLTFPLAILAMRAIDFSYTAQIRMFVLPQRSQSIFDSSSGLLVGAGLERDNLLLGQASLIKSTKIFEAVKKVDLSLEKKPLQVGGGQYVIGRAIGLLQELIFGSDYVETRQKWKNLEFSTFKRRISIEANVEAASVNVIYKHPKPEIAIKSVKAAAEALQDVNVQISKTQAEKKVSFLKEKIEEAKRENDRISEQMTEFSRKNKISTDPRSVEPRFKGLLGAREMVDAARLEISQREATLAQASAVSERIRGEIKRGLIEDREGRLSNLTAELRRYDLGISKNQIGGNRISSAVKKQIGIVRKKIESELANGGSQMDVASLQNLLTTNESGIIEQENALRAGKKQLEFGQSQTRKFDRELAALPELDAQLAKLTIIQGQQRKILEHLTQKYLEAQIESDTTLDQFYVTEEPMLIDSERLGKLPILLSILTLIMLLVVSYLVIMDLLSGVISSKQQLIDFQTPQYLGALPFLAGFRDRKGYAVITETGLGYRLAHVLRKHLNHYSASKSGHVVAVTSRSAKVGKTVTSASIALAVHSGGAKVLLIDADYLAKERSMHEQFSDGLAAVDSLHQLLENCHANASASHKRQKIAFWSIASEFKDEASLSTFMMNDLAKVIPEMRSYFDLIVIDCAPCFVPEMLAIYEQADATILCFAEGQSTVKDVENVTEAVAPATREDSGIFSVLTMTQQKSNLNAPNRSDTIYYKAVKAA
jgi:Mrp family chromosome partitioning ATPase